MNDNEQALRSVLAETLAQPVDVIGDDSSMETIDGWDSLKQLQIVLALEERFGVSFDEEGAMEITSLSLIREALREQGISL